MRWPLNPGSVQSQTGQSFEKPDLGKAVLDCDRRSWTKQSFKVPPNTKHEIMLLRIFFKLFKFSGFVSVAFGQVVMELKHLPPDSDCSACSYKHSLKSLSKSPLPKPGCFAFLVFEICGENYRYHAVYLSY